MQARKLIRLLSEMIDKEPSLAYARVCVDKRYTENFEPTFREISDCETRICYGWNDDADIKKQIIVLGNY